MPSFHGFSVVETPEAIKFVRTADAKGMAVETLNRAVHGALSEEKITTLVCPLEYLTPIPWWGSWTLMSRDAYRKRALANALIMIDTSANLQRLKTLISEGVMCLCRSSSQK